MSENVKKVIAISVILLVLAIFASYSLFMLALNQKKQPAPSRLSPIQEALPSDSTPEEPLPSSEKSRPADYIPTPEEIEQHIEDQSKKRKTMEDLIAARNIKAEKVVASAIAALSSPMSQETTPEKTPPAFSPEARAERNKELRNGIKDHRYFPR